MVNYLMSYVNKNTALRNLANSDKLFLKFKTNFLNRYINCVEELTNLVASNDVNGVYDYINSIKSYALKTFLTRGNFSHIIFKVLIADNLYFFSFELHPLHKRGIKFGHSFRFIVFEINPKDATIMQEYCLIRSDCCPSKAK